MFAVLKTRIFFEKSFLLGNNIAVCGQGCANEQEQGAIEPAGFEQCCEAKKLEHDITQAPGVRTPALQEMLPSENCLLSVFDFRAKYITDVENKFKFLFRSLQANQLKIFITGCDRVNR